MERWRQALRRIGPPAATPLFAFALRCIGHPTVLTGEGIVPFGNDAYYHLRRIAFTLERWPSSLGFDPYLHYPEGAVAIWPPLFDWVVATLLLPIHALAGEHGALVGATFVPPLLGALCVLVLHLFARHLFGEPVASVAAVILALLSGHIWYSQIGFVDHHAAVALVSTLQLAACAALIERLRVGEGRTGRLALLLGALCGAALWLWPGALLFVGLCVVGVGASVLASSAALFQRALEAFCLLCCSAAVVVVFASSGTRLPQFGEFSPVVLSHFQPWLFSALLVQGGATLLWWRRGGGRRGATHRAGGFLGAGLAVLAASLILAPGLLTGALDAWRWGTRDEAFQRLVAESLPILAVGDGLGVTVLERRLSYFAYGLPLLLVWMASRARTHSQPGALYFVVFWTASLALMTLLQRRFFDALAVGLALVSGWGLVRAHALLRFRLAQRWGRGRKARLVALVAAVLVLAVALSPSLSTLRAPLANGWRDLRGEPLELVEARARGRAMVRAARWLRASSAPTRGWLEPGVRPAYGVWTPWDVGHLVRYEARRPVLVDNFGDDLGDDAFERARAYTGLRETEGAALLSSLGARYVIVRRGPAGEGGAPGTLGAQLTALQPPPLERHRLVFEGPGSATVLSPDLMIRIYERVEGARLRGVAAPGATVSAHLSYRTQLGRRGRFEAATRADDAGRFEMIVAQPSRESAPALDTARAWTLRSGDARASVVVEARDVVAGRSIDVPPWSAP